MTVLLEVNVQLEYLNLHGKTQLNLLDLMHAMIKEMRGRVYSAADSAAFIHLISYTRSILKMLWSWLAVFVTSCAHAYHETTITVVHHAHQSLKSIRVDKRLIEKTARLIFTALFSSACN